MVRSDQSDNQSTASEHSPTVELETDLADDVANLETDRNSSEPEAIIETIDELPDRAPDELSGDLSTGAMPTSTEDTAIVETTLETSTAESEPEPQLESESNPIAETTLVLESSALTVISTVIPIAEHTAFNLEAFKQTFVDNLLQVKGQSLQTVTLKDCYTTLVAMVQQRLLQLRPPTTDLAHRGVRMIGEITTEIWVESPLKTNLVNLGIYTSVGKGLQELGFDLNSLVDLESERSGEEISGGLMGDYLESLSTARLPAIGYGIRPQVSPTGQSHAWEVARSETNVLVKFGGETQVYTDAEGRLRVQWKPQIVIKGIPYDTLIPGYCTNTVSLLRLWQAESSPESAAGSLSDLPELQSGAQPQSEEQRLRQQFFLTSCAIQDVIWLHEQAGGSIETLHERFVLQLNDATHALAIVELMHWLVDEYELEWDQAWAITQKTFSCTLHSWMPDAEQHQSDDRWSIEVFSRLLPRHLEILYEINRRFLQEAEASYPNNGERIRRLSLIDESGERYVRVSHLACLGSYAISGVSTWHSHLLQRTGLSDFAELYPGKFGSVANGINLRRCLVQSNPHLTNLITRWIGEDWITQPQVLKQLEELIQNTQFCGDWWQVRRTIKQEVAHSIRQQTGIEINVSSLFDVQVVPIAVSQRQLLNLLHVITLYVRLKVNAMTDTIQHFSHRSVPRTCIFAGHMASHDPIAASIAQLMEAVANTINNDPEVQGKLQVIVLAGDSLTQDRFRFVRQLYAAADLAEYLPLAGESAPRLTPLPFALNGAILLGSCDSTNMELQQAVGAKNAFLFGRNAAEVNRLQAQGYNPLSHYSSNPDLQQVISPIASGYFSGGDSRAFQDLGNWLLSQDPTLVLAEYPSYMDCQERVSQSYQDQKQWTRMSILTTARMGQFSSDCTIQNYQNIWQQMQ